MVYHSHFKAAEKWGVPFLKEIVGQEALDNYQVEVTVTSREERYERKGHKVHLRTTKLPDDAVVLKDGEWTSSPELVFLELAHFLDIQKLILLGMSLCSYPPGRPNAALTTKEKIQDLLEKAVWHRGRRKALRAIKYVKEGSNSFLESFVSMIVGLPHLLGGFCLKDILLNYRIELDEESSQQLRQDACHVDIYLEKYNLAIEYQSKEHHSKPEEKARDKMRKAAVERQGVKVIELDTLTFYSFRRFFRFIEELFKLIGRRLYIRTHKFGKMHRQLRSMLPRGAPT